VRAGGEIVILDAGSGLRLLGDRLLGEHGEQPLRLTVLLSHTHWDHIQGFPFFIPAYSPKANVRILGSGAVHSLRNALGEQMQDAFFPVRLNELASHVVWDELTGDEVKVEGLKVLNIHANHPAMCRGYRICTPQGDVVYMPDHEGYERNAIERQKLNGEAAPALLDDARKRDQEIVEFFREADVVITDTQYDNAEYPGRLDWGHSCVDDVVDIAMRAGVRHLFLFHHDPDHNDEKMEAMVAEAKERVAAAGSSMLVSAAREGAEIVLE
jgi:phosphoribosyl 1,2-cyclic phosphodiesterase